MCVLALFEARVEGRWWWMTMVDGAHEGARCEVEGILRKLGGGG